MSNNVMQSSFSAGELAPTLFARVDLAKYHVGSALMKNFFVDYRGGASSRPGTEFICQCQDSNLTVILIPFQFNISQTYMLEFGNQYMRVIKDGAPVLEPAKIITNITQSVTATVSVAAHGFSSGDTIFIQSVVGMTQINNGTFLVVVIDPNTFIITYLDNSPVNSTAFTAYSSGGTASRVYQIGTPYLSADLRTLKFTQSADVMTITHPSYAPRNLTRTGHAAWTLTIIVIGSSITAPVGLAATPSAAGTTDYKYAVTAVAADGDESVASTVLDRPLSLDLNSVAGSIAITWTVHVDAVSYNIYKALPAVNNTIPSGASLGFMASATGNGVIDTNIVPNFVVTPPSNTNPLNSNNPATVAYFQQRRVYAGSNSFPDSAWFSQPGSFDNFNVSNPVQEDDAITVTLASQQVNNIKHMIPMPGGLILLTGGGAWQVSGAGGINSPITPTSISAQPQAYNGCSDVRPIPINYDILYVQARGSVIRDLSYSFYTNIYTGIDISLLSSHFFYGKQVVEWGYAEEPFKIIWTVRDDGRLLSLTYLKEQEVIGWAQHDTLGTFESVATIREGQEDAVYFIVRRNIGGNWLRYIERMASRLFTYGVEDAWCVDCGLTNTIVAQSTTLTLSAASGSTILGTATVGVFTSNMVGWIVRAGGGIMEITEWRSPQVVVLSALRDVQDVLSDGTPAQVASGEWSVTEPFDDVSGLRHLEGKTVQILGDGNVFPEQVVTNGEITLPHDVTKVVVGLKFTPKLQTLNLDTGEPTIQGKFKKISALTVRVTETRGLKMGSTFDTLKEFKMRSNQPLGTPIPLQTGDQRIIMDNSWNTEGRICVQQDYPLPATVLGVIPEVTLGST